ncbi:hypothetical protein ACJMK2_011026 [Sinanodonta woodiana]|uniref:Uncharacterized protein n=1 Tax=Sinanodonta woodiana TaxID=1069815 RepID=A0ABD3V6V0_SINWO
MLNHNSKYVEMSSLPLMLNHNSKYVEMSKVVVCFSFLSESCFLHNWAVILKIDIYETYPSTFNCLYSLQDEDTSKRPLPVTQIRFRAYESGEKVEYSHILIASYASGMVKFWHYSSGKSLHTIKEPSTTQILTLAINPQNTHFITSGDNPHIHQYDIHTFQLVNTFFPSDGKEIMDGHRCRVFAVQYHPTTDHTFISGGWDNTVQYWDDREKHSVKRISGPHICGDALDIDPKHDHILTGSWRKEKTLQIWDFPSGEWIKDVPQEPMNGSQIYCCQWLGTDSIICGGTDQNMARVIDRGTLNTTGQLVDLPQSVYCIDNDHHGHHPVTAIGSNKFIFLVKEEKQATS